MRWAEAVIGDGAKVVRVVTLGGWTAAVHRLDLRTRSGTVAVVLKRYVRPDLAVSGSGLPAQEVQALQLLRGSGIPLPVVLGADLAPGMCDAPALLMSLVPGRPRISPGTLALSVMDLGRELARIHALRAAPDALPAYRPWFLDAPDVPPTWAHESGAWQEAFGIARGPRPVTLDRLIHRDYNPWNVLWQSSAITGIVDWANACIGPAEIDVAHMRHNLWAISGPALAEYFLASWKRATGTRSYDPAWDILSAVEWLPDMPPAIPARIARRHEAFLLAALRRRI